ncbi:MAG: tetratricopeptide repeat-containing sensor histidine kinase [Bacteroidales bacterium]|nr:tetratricopeptide repeat-containing sensor histidine kinase [Bacteroidales bacterium]
MQFKILLTAILINLSFIIFGQSIDTVKDILKNTPEEKKAEFLLQTAKSLTANDPNKSSEYINKALLYLNKYRNDSLKGEAYSLAGKAQYYLANYDSALIAMKYALEIFQSIEYDKGIAAQYNIIGVWYYSAASDYEKALDYYLLSLKKREEINDSVGIAYSHSNIGNIYYKQNRRDKAIESFEKGLLYAKGGNDKNIISILLNNLGAEYEEKKEYEKALDYYIKSSEIKKELNNQIRLAVTYGSIGNLYQKTGKYKEALEYYNKAVELLKGSSDKHYTALIYKDVAVVYKEMEEYKKALNFLNKSHEIAIEIYDKSLLRDDYKEYTDIYALLHNYEKAFMYQKKYIAFHDTIFNEESDERMKETEVKYETEKKEKENEILKTQQKINELELEKKTNRQYYLIAGSLIFLLLAILIFSRYRLKQKTNLILEESNRKLIVSEQNLKESVTTKDKFFSIIAHDLRNPLSSLTLVSQVLDENIDELSSEKLKYYIGSINNAANSLLNLVENLLNWARTQTHKISISYESFDLHNIIDQNISLLKFNAEKKSIQITNNIKKGTIIIADINLLTTVIRNLLANAIKFTEKNGYVEINMKEKTNYFEVYVSDTGIGMSDEDLKKLFRIDIDTTSVGDSSEKGTGLGLILCKEFIEMNGGNIRAESEPEKGSSFIFTVKKGNV